MLNQMDHPLSLLKIIRKRWRCMKAEDVSELLDKASAYHEAARKIQGGSTLLKALMRRMSLEDQREFENLYDVSLKR